ncbi:MAG: DUF4276 family protein [Elusimicrobia bacterium]|nr:DUF4276 family protein [Elusimicrobiota bacterium]
MKKVLLLVEGQTEEKFVKDMLRRHFNAKQIYLMPILIGGRIRYSKLKKEIQNLLRDSSADCVTTMIDFYAMDSNCPGRAAPQGRTAREKAAFVEQELSKDINHLKFKPYISVYEFEALLFSEPKILSAKPGVPVEKITAITEQYASPEDIDDSPTASPSHRIESIYPGYPKIRFGYEISSEIGLPVIRIKCPHFNDWLTTLENL